MKKSKQKINKRNRSFSEAARKSIIKEIENGLSKSEACRKYDISVTSIYNWLRKYSTKYKKSKKTVVGLKSDVSKYKELRQELKQVYELLGRSQTEVLYLKKILELASEDMEIDLKKTIDMSQSDFSMNLKKKK